MVINYEKVGILHFLVYSFCHFEHIHYVQCKLREKSLNMRHIRFLVVSLLEMTIESVNYLLCFMKDAKKFNKFVFFLSCFFFFCSLFFASPSQCQWYPNFGNYLANNYYNYTPYTGQYYPNPYARFMSPVEISATEFTISSLIPYYSGNLFTIGYLSGLCYPASLYYPYRRYFGLGLGLGLDYGYGQPYSLFGFQNYGFPNFVVPPNLSNIIWTTPTMGYDPFTNIGVAVTPMTN